MNDEVLEMLRDATKPGTGLAPFRAALDAVVVDRARFARLLRAARAYAEEHHGYGSSLSSDDPWTDHFEPGDFDPLPDR